HSDASKDSPTKPQTSAGSFDWLKFVSWSLVAGSLASVAWLLYGQLRVWRLCLRAMAAPDFARAELQSLIGASVQPPRLLVIDDVAAGATGLWRPTILVPREAVAEAGSAAVESRLADRESLRALLAHE